MNDLNTIQRKPTDYRNEYKPVWCTGCGDYAVLKSFTRAFAKLNIPNERIAVVSGIGCSSRLPGYLDTYGFNTLHGRALPIAQGLKAARPDLTVLACGGDGDCFAIGTGHFPHAIRRNPDITYVVMDNSIYGLTKGQASPTTSRAFKEQKGLIGVEEPPVNPAYFAFSMGAPFVARTHAGNMAELSDLIAQGIQYPGFAFIHCLSVCVTYQGRGFQEEIDRHVHATPANYNPGDERAVFDLLRSDPFAMGVLYKKPLDEAAFDGNRDVPVE